MQIEFFHDVVCSFCFPMSYRMRQIQKIYPAIQIIHRSFPLVWEAGDFEKMFKDRKSAKAEILTHWKAANQNDDLHRFNIEGMRQKTFDFPTSRNGLMAAKAAGLIAGEEGYWEAFDSLQQALFVENQDIEKLEVIYSCVQDTSLPFCKWEEVFHSPLTLEKLEEDFALVAKYKITSVPCLVINQTHQLHGAQPLSEIIAAIESLQKEEPILEKEGGSCSLLDGKVNCN